MSVDSERVYTINLGKVLLSQSQHRAVRAVNMIREFARRHMKVEEIKIEESLAHQIWARGVRSPPRKIRVRMNRTEEGHVLVSQYMEDLEAEPAKAASGAGEAAAESAEPAAQEPGAEAARLGELAEGTTAAEPEIKPEPPAEVKEPEAAKPEPPAEVKEPEAKKPEEPKAEEKAQPPKEGPANTEPAAKESVSDESDATREKQP